MNTTGTAFESNMVADNNKRCSVDKRMSGLHIFKLTALDDADSFVIGNACVCHCLGSKVGSHYIILAVCL